MKKQFSDINGVKMSGYIVLGTSIGVGTKRYGHELTVVS